MSEAPRPELQTAVQVRRKLACRREEAFQAWTDPELVPRWFMPRDGSAAPAQMDVRPGGSYRWALERSGRVAYAVGKYLEVDPPSRLVFSFGWEQMPGIELTDSLVTVEFHGQEDEVEIVITHERLRDPHLRELHGAGWDEMLDNLRPILTSSRATNTP